MDAGETPDRAWEQLAEAARIVADAAATCDMVIAMEPLAPPACNFFTHVEQGAQFVDRIDHPRLKLLADLYHVQKSAEPVTNVGRAGRRLAHIHLATPTVAGLSLPPEPFDFAGFFKALRTAGYDGRVSVEDNPGLLGKAPRPLAPTFKAIREYLLTLGA
jgi:sugar phosphate isomerase/epimerase